MKRFTLLFTAFAILFISSCSASGINVANKIIPPSNITIPISGVWKVERYKQGTTESADADNISNLMVKLAVFDKDTAAVGEDICSEPTYKIKNVQSSDYLLYQYKVSPEYLGLTAKNIQIISVTSKNNFFYEFMKVNDNETIAYIDGVFLYFKKTSDSPKDINLAIEEGRHSIAVKGIDTDMKRSGVLLGFRTSRKSSDSSQAQKTVDYKTLWISSIDGQLNTIYGTNDLFVPRKSGFWKIGVNYDRPGRQLFAYPMDKGKEESSPLLSPSPFIRTILYVGNDYISTEQTNLYSSRSTGKSTYQVIPIDNIESPRSVKISDISGIPGRKALIEGASKLISSDMGNNILNKEYNEESFALVRRNGHWVMRGRINSSSSSSPAYFDYNIKAIPPSRLVTYDDLAVSWNRIKAKVPEAVDAYTSPMKDIAIIITGNSILVYPITDGILGNGPLKKLKLKDKDAVVMAEWAIGRYTEKWDKEFRKNDVYVINE